MRRSPLSPLVLALLALVLAAAPAAAAPRTGSVQLGAAGNDHGFQFGPPEYLTTLARYDSVTPESAMNIWALQPREGVWDWSNADRIVDWATRNGKQVHAVPLIWCTNDWTTDWIEAKAWTPESMRAWIRSYVATVMRRYAGRIKTWDVVNEAFNADGTVRDCIWSRVLGLGYVEEAFRAARAADPAATLLYNEYRAENPAGRKFLATEALARDFVARGVPIDGVGLQFHIFGLGPFQWQIEEAFRRIEALGLSVHISELDVPLNFVPGATQAEKLDRQAQAYQTIAAACQRVLACFRLTTWGFTDAYSFRGVENASLPWDTSYRAKPAWSALQRVLRPPGATAGVPGAPGRPVASPTAVTGQFALSWTAAVDPDGQAMTYALEHADADDPGWTPVATGIRGLSYAFPHDTVDPRAFVERQGTWRYRVRAWDPRNEGTWSAELRDVKVDRTAPPAPAIESDRAAEDPAGGWWRDRVTLRVVGADAVLPDGSAGIGIDAASVPAAQSFATTGSHTMSGTVTDRAGLVSPSASRTVKVDAAAPAAALTCPASVTQGTAASATWSASDDGSGLAGAASGSVALDSTTTGTKTARTDVSDRVGHLTTATCAYTVAARPVVAPPADPAPTDPPPPPASEEPAASAPLGAADPLPASQPPAATSVPSAVIADVPALAVLPAPRLRGPAAVRLRRDGRLVLRLTCGAPCRGVLTLRAGRVVLGRASFSGRRATVRVRITSAGRRLLARRRVLRAVATAPGVGRFAVRVS